LGEGARAAVVYDLLRLLSRSLPLGTPADAAFLPIDGSAREVGDPVLVHPHEALGLPLARGSVRVRDDRPDDEQREPGDEGPMRSHAISLRLSLSAS